ncbi:MAG: exodeoxyribonuclease VII large subunit [Gammaproteobacteria bacterium]|nr:exodeoxyribonuclease VII large subunit [Gammaproteobacteria bacterium]
MKTKLTVNDAVWTVSALNFEVKTILSEGIGSLWIEGEVSNFVRPASGHWYFSLKDARAQCRAAMFKGRNSRMGFTPVNGQQVLLKALVTLYEARGEYQLIVDHIEDAGVGDLKRRYEQLRNQLDSEGLFANSRKQALPEQPQHIGIITSPTGAAIRDALSVIRRRAPHIPVTIFPTQVQGEAAATQIRHALDQVVRFEQCDIVLMIRGGGSLEDMWCFNDEALARQIAEFPLPIVTGIGHEIDFTIADFVADFRAPTPSVAAETVTPDSQELMQTIDASVVKLLRQMQLHLTINTEQLSQLERHLNNLHPKRRFEQLRLRLKLASEALIHHLTTQLSRQRAHLVLCQAGFLQYSPLTVIKQHQQNLDRLSSKNTLEVKQNLLLARHKLALQAKTLDTLSPLKTLARGFATINKGDQLVSSVKQLKTGDEVDITLCDGNKQAAIL